MKLKRFSNKLILIFVLVFIIIFQIFMNTNFIPIAKAENDTELDFGTILKGDSATRTIGFVADITNTNTIEGYLISDNFWIVLDPEKFTLKPEESINIKVTVNTSKLSAQDYNGQFHVYTTGIPSKLSYNVKVKVVERKPLLKVSEKEIDFGVVAKDKTYAKKIEISNIGYSELSGNLKSNKRWLMLSDNNFSIDQLQAIFIVVTINTEGLDEQYYSGEIKIDSNGGNETITVRMRVKVNQPYLTVSPTVIDLGDIKSGEIIEKELTIKNEGDGILEGEIETTTSWIEVSEREFRISKGKILKVKCKFNPLILDVGKYKEKIVLASNIGNYEVTVLINRLHFPPKLMISTDNIDFGDVEIGSMSNSSINIWNDGEEPLKIKIINSENWLILSQDEFILYKSQNTTLFLSINAETTINEGIYEDSIDILSNGGNKKLRVKVNFTEQKITIELQIGNKFARVNGTLYELDAPPKLIKNRTFVPIRFISETMQAKVNWIGHPTNEVQIYFKDIIIHLWVGNNFSRIEYLPQLNKKAEIVKLDAPPTIVNNRVLVPLRFISETFGAYVNWNPEDQSIKIILKLKREI